MATLVKEGDGGISRSAPRRRVVCQIQVGADSWQDAAAALDGIAFRLHEAREKGETEISVISGGVSSGYALTADEDLTITHDSYMAGIEALMAGIKARRGDAE